MLWNMIWNDSFTPRKMPTPGHCRKSRQDKSADIGCGTFSPRSTVWENLTLPGTMPSKALWKRKHICAIRFWDNAWKKSPTPFSCRIPKILKRFSAIRTAWSSALPWHCFTTSATVSFIKRYWINSITESWTSWPWILSKRRSHKLLRFVIPFSNETI